MAAKKKTAIAKAAPRRKRGTQQEEATSETPTVPLPENRDASRPPRY